MGMISTVSPGQASGSVAQVYGQIEQAFGRVPNGMRLFSSSPALLGQHWQQLGYYMQHPRLSFPLLAFIRMLVSQRHDCEYCMGLNESMLVNMGGFAVADVLATKLNPVDAPLPEKDKAMLLAVLKTVEAPKTLDKADLDRLRALGWEDGDILDAVYHGARNVAMDIMFNAFQVEKDF